MGGSGRPPSPPSAGRGAPAPPGLPARRRREIRVAYLLLSPAVLLLLAVLAYPVGWEVWTSLTDLSPLKSGGTAFVGLENYRRFLGDP